MTRNVDGVTYADLDRILLHLGFEARATVDGFGLMTISDFDLLLLRGAKPTATASR